MKIQIVRQYGARLKPIGDLTTSNWKRYADKHGYDFEQVNVGIQIEEPNRKKLFAIHDKIVASPDSGWLFWADADTAVTNMDIKLESFIEQVGPEQHLIFDVSQYGLSTGNFFARNSDTAAELLRGAMIVGEVNREVNSRYASIDGHDESTLKLLIESFPRYFLHTATLKIADFPRTHTPESFILHASQRTEAERIELLSPYCK